MWLFDNKNTNEKYYNDGQKHWTDVIKNSAPSDEILLWRQPEEDFNTDSTLIVMPGEEAIFVKSGNIEGCYDEGTYKLSTDNFPFISRLRNAFSGGISRFNCVVYFARKTVTKEIKWGTETPIQVRDKVWGIRVDARVRAAYKLRIDNAAKFLQKLVGNNIRFECTGELNDYFSSEFQGKIKSAISKYLNELQQELIGIDAYMDELSEKIEPFIDEITQEYGLKCVNFSLAGLDIDKSKYEEIDSAQLESIKRNKLAQSEKKAMDILDTNWDKVQTAKILDDVANNSGNIGFLGGVAAGIGFGTAAGNSINKMAGDFIGNTDETPKENKSGASDDPIVVLGKLKQLLDAGLIDQTDYDAKKSDILNKM